MKRAVSTMNIILDRDGTLIEHIPYLCDPGQVRVLPTVVEGLRELRQVGCGLFLHTNQSGVGRGLFSLEDAVACNERMIRQIGLGQDLFKKICLAPEAPDQEMVYRKPSPRFGLELIEEYSIDKDSICYVGDNVTDMLAAKNLGCAGVGVNTGLHDLREMLAEQGLTRDFPVFDNFRDAATFILNGCR